jgi:hypothetical protein
MRVTEELMLEPLDYEIALQTVSKVHAGPTRLVGGAASPKAF